MIVQSIHWFNPVPYFIRRTLDKYCELSCDEAVIRDLDLQSRIAYGSTLLNLASARVLPQNVLATTLSEGKRRLKERVDGIRNFKKQSVGSVALMATIVLLLTGCALVIPQTEQTVVTITPTAQIVDGSGTGTAETPQNSQDAAPTEQDVLAMRQAVEAGMSSEEIAWLTEVIKQTNLWWEQRYMWEDIFGWSRLGDPENLTWNYFDQTGVIQIGWADSSDADGTQVKVVVENEYDADAFISVISELKATVQSGLVDEDFDRLMELCAKAKATHDVRYAIEMYHMLHDMDYFLLRCGMTDVEPYVEDTSTLSVYYGAFSVWNRAKVPG